MSLPALLVAAFLAGLALGGGGIWKVQAWRFDSQNLAQQKKAEAREDQWQQDAATNEEVQREELDALNSAHVGAISRVRDNFKRMPKATCPASDAASATALQLYEQGAVDLVSIAADADKVAADLRACQAWVSSVTK